MLARVIGSCWHALVRDIIALGYTKEDIFTTLDLADMVAIVTAAPPGTSVRWYLDGGWTRTDHLIANMQEGNAGLANLSEPYQRPGTEMRTREQSNNGEGSLFANPDVLDWDEFTRMETERYQLADQYARDGIKTQGKVRTL